MSGVIKSAGVVIIGGVIGVWSLSQSEAEIDRIVAHYDLDERQIEFTKSCESSLDVFNKRFKDGARTMVGCGCMAAALEEASGPADPVNYDMLADALYSVIKFSETSSRKTTDVAGMFAHMTNDQGISYSDALLASGALSQAMSVCNDAELPKQNNAVSKDKPNTPYQPAIITPVSTGNGCDDLSAASVETLRQIAERDGKTLEQLCENVIS